MYCPEADEETSWWLKLQNLYLARKGKLKDLEHLPKEYLIDEPEKENSKNEGHGSLEDFEPGFEQQGSEVVDDLANGSADDVTEGSNSSEQTVELADCDHESGSSSVEESVVAMEQEESCDELNAERDAQSFSEAEEGFLLPSNGDDRIDCEDHSQASVSESEGVGSAETDHEENFSMQSDSSCDGECEYYESSYGCGSDVDRGDVEMLDDAGEDGENDKPDVMDEVEFLKPAAAEVVQEEVMMEERAERRGSVQIELDGEPKVEIQKRKRKKQTKPSFNQKAQPEEDYVAEFSEHGKVTGVSWQKGSSSWQMRAYRSDGTGVNELFSPKHHDLPTNSEQVKAAHRKAAERRAEFYIGFIFWFWFYDIF